VQTWRLHSDGLTKKHDNAEFVWIRRGAEADDSRDQRRDQEEEGAAGEASATRHKLLDLVLAALEELFEVWRTLLLIFHTGADNSFMATRTMMLEGVGSLVLPVQCLRTGEGFVEQWNCLSQR